VPQPGSIGGGISISQRLPVYSGGQVQAHPLPNGLQVPPLKHGLLSHGSSGVVQSGPENPGGH